MNNNTATPRRGIVTPHRSRGNDTITSPAELHNMLSNQSIQNNHCNVIYTIASINKLPGYSLVDRGDNGGVTVKDVILINKSYKKVSIQGIDHHHLIDVPMDTVGSFI